MGEDGTHSSDQEVIKTEVHTIVWCRHGTVKSLCRKCASDDLYRRYVVVSPVAGAWRCLRCDRVVPSPLEHESEHA